MNNKTKDFVLAVLTCLFGIFVTSEGLKMVQKASAKPYNVVKFSLSPGFLPTVLGIMLIFFSLLLLFFSLRVKGEKMSETVSKHVTSLISAVKKNALDPNMHRMVIGMAIMAVFTFFLVGFRVGNFMLPFYISGGLFVFALLMYLGAVKGWQAFVITVVSMVVIVVLFQYGFNAILP